jgi:multidrug efflux system membrane fusion protein
MPSRISPAVLAAGLTALAAAGGCKPNQPQAPAAGPPAVPASKPVSREVTEYVEYTGRADAVESVGVRARVTGYITQAPFKEGAEVKKGDLLFEIDPRPYKAQLQQAEGQVRVAEAQLGLAKANLNRIQGLVKTSAVSQQEVDQARATAEAAEAQVTAAKATAEVYRLNLEYTRVTSPIDGQVSRFYFTPGNLVSQDQTLLTTVVSTDPMYAYFDMDERTVLRIRTAVNQGRIRPRGAGNDLPVLMGLEGEDGFPHRGTVDFVNNVVNPSTGTIAVRGVFPNPRPTATGRRLLSPGMFVRIRLPLGQPRPTLLVVDRAVGSDQGLKYVYVIDAEKKVRYRRVRTGPLEDDGLRVIEDGLKPDDVVAVGAIQQLRPGTDVEPEMTPMPTPGAPAPPATPPGSAAPTPPKSAPGGGAGGKAGEGGQAGDPER